jgi:glycine/D-amino acid oxidase-like deaminating enzyme
VLLKTAAMKTADAIIVGGGIIGCASAYYLAARGIRPLILERRGIATEASGANAGVVGASSGIPGKTLAHTKKSIELLLKDAEDFGRPVELVREGRLVLAANEVEWAEVQEFVTTRQAEGIEARLLSADDLRALEPGLGPGFVGAAFAPGDGHVNPFLLTHAYAAAARRLGAEVYSGIEAIRLETSGNRVTGVLTQTGSIAAPLVIVAAGAWSSGLLAPLGIAIPVRPGRGQMLVTEPLAPLTPRAFRTGEIAIRQDVHGHMIIGSTVEDVGFNREVTLPVLSQFCRCAIAVMPALRDARIIRAWAGLRPMTPDSLAIVDAVPGADGLFLTTGHSRTGMTYAAVSAWLLAQLATEGTTGLPLDPFRIERFPAAAVGSVADRTSAPPAVTRGPW